MIDLLSTHFQVSAQSTATAIALTHLYPALHFIVQISELGSSSYASPQSMSNVWPLGTPCSLSGVSSPGSKPTETQQRVSPRIAVQQRISGTQQSVYDAAVYILRLPLPMPGMPSGSLSARIIAELRAHIGVLRANSCAELVITACLLPESDTMDPDVEAIARLRDLSLLQLANEREIKLSELMDMLNSVRDDTGRLVLVNKLHSRNNATVAFRIQYQAYTNRHELRPASPND